MIEAWAKVYEICESVQAKVATILWALQLAKSENLESIEVKGDTKNCVDVLKESCFHVARPILTLISDLSISFAFVNLVGIGEKLTQQLIV